ncbi:MAG: PD-(D/E)XK nuclease family protein [Armatimonadota bacterium]
MSANSLTPWWSFALFRSFNRCKREFFYDFFWGQNERWKWCLYEMKRLRTLKAFRGTAVHDVIANLLEKSRRGERVNKDAALSELVDVLRRGYMESSSGWWNSDLRPPDLRLKDVTCLLEHYYRFEKDLVDAEFEEQLEYAKHCIENLFKLDVWKRLLQSNSKRWMAIDRTQPLSFDLDGVRVILKLDFACEFGSRRVVDWKTGAPSSDDRFQLALYSLYAEKQWGWSPPTSTKLTAVYLYPEASRAEFCVTEQDIQNVCALVKRSFAEMMEPVHRTGRPDENDYPRTESSATCPKCRFQGVCSRESERVREILANNRTQTPTKGENAAEEALPPAFEE